MGHWFSMQDITKCKKICFFIRLAHSSWSMRWTHQFLVSPLTKLNSVCSKKYVFVYFICFFSYYWVSVSCCRHHMFDTNGLNFWQYRFFIARLSVLWRVGEFSGRSVLLQSNRFRSNVPHVITPTSTRRPLINNVIICYFQCLKTMTGLLERVA